MRRLLYIVGAAIVGIVALVYGFKEFSKAKKLQSGGKTAVAAVTDAEEKRGRRGRKSYYVTLNFTTEAGQTVQDKTSVSRSAFEEAMSARQVQVTYLPANPAVYKVGREVKPSYSGFVVGGICLVVAVGMLVGGRRQ